MNRAKSLPHDDDQVAILDALPAHIALLDAEGHVVWVNEAWRGFVAANGVLSPGYGTGVDYLSICDNAAKQGASEARQAAEGIRSVLVGGVGSYSIQYPCHSPARQRWFLLTVTPVSVGRSRGAVVMHLDITAERSARESLRASEALFRQMAEGIREVFFLIDVQDNRMLYVSPVYEQIWGRSAETLYASLESWLEAVHPDDRASAQENYEEGRREGTFEFEFRIVRPEGTVRWIEVKGCPVRGDEGAAPRVAGVAEDITERKKAAGRILHLNRMYALLSGINSAIVRIRDRQVLFEEACRIAVEDGDFGMAWIGLLDTTTLDITPAAWAGPGAGEYAGAKSTARSDTPAGQGAVGRAIRERRPVYSNDILNEPGVGGRRRAEAAARGFRSLISLPLLLKGDVIGNFSLFARGVDFFTAEEVKLLAVLADNISFALENLQRQERLDYVAWHDELTGLANRGLFLDRVTQYLHSAKSGGHGLAVFLVDLERFKDINDSLGQPSGDALLKQVAEWLARTVGGSNLVARIGADHFAVVMPEVRREGNLAGLLASATQKFQSHPFRLSGRILRIAFKAGGAVFPEDGADAGTLFKNAEAALKTAKASGERCLFFTPAMTSSVAGRLTLENQLRLALDRGEFVLHYQPKVSFADNLLTGAEALIRWNDPVTGLVAPASFIPILEETGLIHEVGRWALRKAIADHLRWRIAGLPAVRVAVNVSPLQLRGPAFIEEIRQAVGVDGMAAGGLELEITESVIMRDATHSVATLRAIRALGVTIAIDDFGTGFSSLSYLSKLPVDTIKIDRSFVVDMTAGPEGLALVSTIIRLAHSLKLKVVAEGVETEEQSRLLRLLDCDERQGYLLSKPLPSDIFESRFLAAASAPPSRESRD